MGVGGSKSCRKVLRSNGFLGGHQLVGRLLMVFGWYERPFQGFDVEYCLVLWLASVSDLAGAMNKDR